MITKYDIRATDFNSATKKELVELSCKSTDTLPTTGIMNGSLAMEVDTGKIYAFDEAGGKWNEIGSSGGGGGGGGSSDFSTAEVTVVNNSSYPCELKGSFIDAGANATVASITDEDGVGTIILYKGNAIMNAFSGEGPINTTASGNAHNLGGNAYMVTGDCTITIS